MGSPQARVHQALRTVMVCARAWLSCSCSNRANSAQNASPKGMPHSGDLIRQHGHARSSLGITNESCFYGWEPRGPTSRSFLRIEFHAAHPFAQNAKGSGTPTLIERRAFCGNLPVPAQSLFPIATTPHPRRHNPHPLNHLPQKFSTAQIFSNCDM